MSPYRIRSGSPPTQATDVVIDAATASAHGITVGQRIQYVINGGAIQTFTVSGIAGYGQSDSLAGATISLFRLDVAQQVLGLQGKFDQIDVAGGSGLSQSDLRDRIASHLPSYAEAATEADAIGQQVAGIDFFFSILRTILLVFALVALFVGSYIIINTFSILIAQRTRELALLRALGATRGQVFRMVLAEALLTGIVASAIGASPGSSSRTGCTHWSAQSATVYPRPTWSCNRPQSSSAWCWGRSSPCRFDPAGAQGQSRRARRGDPRRHRRRAATG